MAPNAKPIFHPSNNYDALSEMLDQQADTNGMKSISETNEDWTDVKHSERKKRDRILDDGVLIGLMRKSDYQGLKRLFLNLSILGTTIYGIKKLHCFPVNECFALEKLLTFLPLYIFYGFQFQCFAFAGQHEFLHRNAFKSKWINDLCLFYTGVFCFEFGKHERLMHKQHHTYTNNIDKDPELVSYYDRETLENEGFRNVPLDRWSYLRMFWDIPYTFKCRLGRVIMSARGIPVDYSGTGWHLDEYYYEKDSAIMKDLQKTAILQLLHWVAFFVIFGQTKAGLQGLFFWWIVPNWCGYPVVNYFRNLEHADCEVSKDPNCLKNTRSVRSNLIIRTLLWDTNYHAEHHCYPMVPFYNLHKLNELMYEHILHKERDHFTTQNFAAFKPGGWIDRQQKEMDEYKKISIKTE